MSKENDRSQIFHINDEQIDNEFHAVLGWLSAMSVSIASAALAIMH